MDKDAYLKLRSEIQSRYKFSGQSDAMAFSVIGAVMGLTAAGIFLSFSQRTGVWLAGQACLGVAILQWFVLVHDLGHGCFFKNRVWNEIFAHFASAFAILPFYPWRYIHAAHHVWTGWKDLDPTMSQIKPRELSPRVRQLADFCWKFWIPVFTLSFSLGNFWNLPKVFRAWKDPWVRLRCAWSCVYLGVLVGFLAIGHPSAFLRVYGLPYLLFLVVADPLLLSQHSHIPQKTSQGEKVTAIPLYDQDIYTRSLSFPRWVSKWVLLYFDRHGVHHFFPSLPLYRLGSLELKPRNEIGWWAWLKAAKAMPVNRLLLESRDQTGVML